MPIAKIQLPDGRIGRFEVPEGTTPEQVQQYAESQFMPKGEAPEQKEGTGRTILEQGLQGATLGFADEISNVLGAGIASALTDEDFTDLLKEAQKRVDERLARQQEQSPVISTLSQVGGALVTGGAGASTQAGKALVSSIGRSGLTGKVVKSGIVGGATGAVSGFGSGEGDFKDRLENAQTGAALGAGIGGAIPAIGSVAKGVINTARSTGKVVTGRSADAIVADILANQDLKAIQKTLKDTGNIESLVDIAGDEARGLLRSVAKKTGGTKNLVTDFLENRSESSGARINELLSKKVSNVDNYFQNLDDLAKGRQVAASPLYKKAYQEGANINRDSLNKLLQDKRIITAIDDAKANLGVRIEAPANSLETLDGAKKALDDIIGTAQRQGQSQKAASYIMLKNQLVKELDNASPTYAKARQVFSGFKSVEDAQQLGKEFFKEDPEQIRRTISQMTPSEHDAYLIGVRRALKSQVDRTADSGDPAKKIFGNKLFRDRIEAAFPDGKGFKEFSARMAQEIRAADTKFKVLGGSRSDFNIAQDGALLLDSLETLAKGNTSVKEKIVDAVFTGVRNRALGITDANANKVANILLDKKQGVDALERLMKKQNANQRAVIQAFIPDFNKIRAEQTASFGIIGGTE